MEKGFKSSAHLNTKQIATIGMLSGIMIFLGLTPFGLIPLPTGVNATIMHIPVIIGAILEGPVVGSFIGLAFGLFSMYRAFTAPTVLSFWFLNPVIAIIPRILIAVVAYYSYKFFGKRFNALGTGIATGLATLANTVGVLTLVYVFYADRIQGLLEGLGTSAATSKSFLFAIGATNGVPEAAISILITVPIVAAVQKIRK